VNEHTVSSPDTRFASTAPGPGPVVLGSHRCGGSRISRVLRPDGSMFTVTVPGGDGSVRCSRSRPWISDDSGRSELTGDGLAALASAAMGPWVSAHCPRT
jgi:hypothetical protein